LNDEALCPNAHSQSKLVLPSTCSCGLKVCQEIKIVPTQDKGLCQKRLCVHKLCLLNCTQSLDATNMKPACSQLSLPKLVGVISTAQMALVLATHIVSL